eukprot:gene15100-biopygen4087
MLLRPDTCALGCDSWEGRNLGPATSCRLPNGPRGLRGQRRRGAAFEQPRRSPAQRVVGTARYNGQYKLCADPVDSVWISEGRADGARRAGSFRAAWSPESHGGELL